MIVRGESRNREVHSRIPWLRKYPGLLGYDEYQCELERLIGERKRELRTKEKTEKSLEFLQSEKSKLADKSKASSS